MLVYKKGDVLSSDEAIVVHGCNCKKAMGAGIAKQVRERCPNAYKADQETLWGDKTKLGTYTYGELEENGMLVVNAYTQYDYSRTRQCVDYEALERAISSICEEFSEDYVGNAIAMPKIGCGLGGGDWKVVSEILERLSERYGRDFHIYEL
jgi:O-acetyl-ADP-ribose deacetylase (regulator of RNase III)